MRDEEREREREREREGKREVNGGWRNVIHRKNGNLAG